ncbi:uncharacterized protein N7459_006874 [Penicillium hispanicum]|uniref:uncharacterized protein n=1 Tax=Penicillium hispanicum TaxID=1080232 RepID=UPI0025423CE1|nr:uncharacterized protein N7459_006874 [Penicillium hispanicum]KAJ5577910.1 hypothetical protein N7459_006874 [Penicillium hispanicum]
MGPSSSPNYKELFERETKLRRQAEEERRQAEEERRQAEEERRQAEEERRQAEERNWQFTRKTSLLEYLRTCHNLFSRPLRVRTPSRSTKGRIPAPQGKYCPARLLPWTDCADAQHEIYASVCSYLQATSDHPPQLFSTVARLEGVAESLDRPLSSERDLEIYERLAVENHVRDIIYELCKIPEAQQQFRLGNGIWFESHTNSLGDATLNDGSLDDADPSSTQCRPRPDQFCIHRADDKNSLLMTVEYKPPHKLTVENLRVGLQPRMDFWNDVVQRKEIPTDEAEKLKYNAEQIVGSVLTQEYHAMLWEGLEVSYVTIGFALVLLRIPQDEPGTLLYFLCEPNMEIDGNDDDSYRQPRTAVARVLCLSLMGSLSAIRDQAWRARAMDQLNTWETSLDLVRSRIPDDELLRAPPGSEYTGSPHTSTEGTSSEWLPSSPIPSPTPQRRTQPRSGCAPSQIVPLPDQPSDDSDSNQMAPDASRKRTLSNVTSSPPNQPTRPRGSGSGRSSTRRQHTVQFCTQRCLLGLQQHGLLDDNCPNVDLHRKCRNDERHPITTEGLVQQLNQQLNKDLDHYCAPFGDCGTWTSGAPFKIVCARYGYTVVGKGTTDRLWEEVSKEAIIYRILRKAQGSAVPVFLGTIDLATVYFLHGAGEIRHMLLMAWGGEKIKGLELPVDVDRELRRSRKEIHSLGVVHGDLNDGNLLWNSELKRILIIDFDDVALDPGLKKRQSRAAKRKLCEAQSQGRKRLRPALA